MRDYSEILGALPERTDNHVKNDRGRLAFRRIFTDPMFIVREETDNDYGVDIQIEALINDGKSPTNIQTHVQLKSSGVKPNSKGEYCYSISISNLNYMVNHPCSFYALYLVNEDKFYFAYSDNVYLLHKKNKKKAKSISIKFNKVLNQNVIATIHHQLIDNAVLFKDIRLKMHEGGFIPGSKLIYGKLVFESSTEDLEEYFESNSPYIYSLDDNGKVIFLHNLLWESTYGPIPRGYQVYHINGNTLDNRNENLDIMKTIDNFDIEGFQKEIEEDQAHNILSLILEGENAVLRDVPPPTFGLFYKIVDELKKSGLQVNSNEMARIKRTMEKKLYMSFV